MEQTKAPFFDIVADDLLLVEERMRKFSIDVHPNLSEALDLLMTSGGKRIRPTLTLLAGGLLGTDRERTISLAAAIEMLHTATLVHDDLIDHALVRRGIPTLNAKWPTGATVLAGDFLFAQAARLAADTASLELIELFSTKLMFMVSGEITQVFGTDNEDLRASYFSRIDAKTASLFEVATEGAALLNEEDEAALLTMRAFGYDLGIAFQIVDDIFDFIGDEQQIGKPVANDLRQGLITLPAIIYFDSHKSDHQLLSRAQTQNLVDEEFEALTEKIQSSGAIESALVEAGEFVNRARNRLEQFPPGEYRDALNELAEYIIQRHA